MAYKITGLVLHIGAPMTLNSKSGNQYIKRDVIIMVRRFDPNTGEPSFDEKNTPKFSFMNDKCQQLDGINVNDVVTVSFDVIGRSYEKEGRTEYITDLRPFSIISDKSSVQNQPQPYQPYQPQPQYAPQAPSQALQPYQSPYPSNPTPFGQQTFPAVPKGVRQNEDDMPF